MKYVYAVQTYILTSNDYNLHFTFWGDVIPLPSEFEFDNYWLPFGIHIYLKTQKQIKKNHTKILSKQ